MNTCQANSPFGFLSPLALQLTRFLALKRAMGYLYREEERALRELDAFLSTRLSPDDPLITLSIARAYVARRGTESETTRAHRLSLIREVCRFLRLDDPRVVLLERECLRIVRQKFLPRVLSRDEGKRFLQACNELPAGRTSPIRPAILGTALRVLYLTGLRAGELLRLTQADIDIDAGTLHIRHAKFDKSRVVPITPDLVKRIVHCRALAIQRFGQCLPHTPLFPGPRGGRYSITALRDAFRRTLGSAGIKCTGSNRVRLHDLRQNAESRKMPSDAPSVCGSALEYRRFGMPTVRATRHYFPCLQGVEELQKLVARSESSGFDVQRCRFGERRFLQSQMGVQIDLSSFHGFMTKPERNDRSIDTGLQQFHGGTVSQYMRRYAFMLQRRTTLLGNADIFGQQVLYSISAEAVSVNIREQDVVGSSSRLLQPSLQNSNGLFRQWCAAFFATFAMTTNMGATA